MKKIELDKKYSVVLFSLSCITEEKDFITSDQKGLLICFIKDSKTQSMIFQSLSSLLCLNLILWYTATYMYYY